MNNYYISKVTQLINVLKVQALDLHVALHVYVKYTLHAKVLFIGYSVATTLTTLCRYREDLHLKDYHNWFTELVTGWIAVASEKCNAEIKRAVTVLDDVRNNIKIVISEPPYICIMA